ncbi:hypothetical protein ISO66_16335 [Morganella morganii subsp. morganii]|uniref:hypothetical protein n=1 Tax=Morganella morganii TaxID=582 RepID=UPI001BDA429C|nr:hypothetical protein [Morganella morganii]MBT0334892.1 hypothetical protein [Morganella morganii subsp. morganii]
MRLFSSVLLIVLIALAPAVLSGGPGAEYNVKITVMGTLLLLANVYLCRYTAGKIVVGLLTILWGLNLSASALFRREAGAEYLTNLPELLHQGYPLSAGDFLSENSGIVLFFIVVSVAYFAVVHLLSRALPRRAIRNAGISLLLLSFILPVEYYAMEKDKTPGLTVYDHYLLGTPLYNLAAVPMAWRGCTGIS